MQGDSLELYNTGQDDHDTSVRYHARQYDIKYTKLLQPPSVWDKAERIFFMTIGCGFLALIPVVTAGIVYLKLSQKKSNDKEATENNGAK